MYKVERYEVTEGDNNGRVISTQCFGPGELATAVQYRQEHPRSTGWTIRSSGHGGRDREVGLHAQ